MPDSSGLKGPFKGLPSFEEADSPIFFGRKSERRLCLNSLAANRITVLYAPSGVGKSSLLAAGVLPDIQAEAWAIAEDREDPLKRRIPGQTAIMMRDWYTDPLLTLGTRVVAEMEAARVPEIPSTEAGITDNLLAWTAWTRGPVYLIFDQFERLYTGGRLDRQTIQKFVETVARLINRSGVWINVLLALREDCLSVLDHIGDFVPAAKRNWISLAELDEGGAKEAILGPVEYWRRNHPSDPEIHPRFVESLLEVTLSPRARAFKAGGEKRFTTALLQLLLKERWDMAVRTGSKLVEAPSSSAGFQEDLNQWVRIRLDAIPGDLQYTAAGVLSRLISAAGRPVQQSHEELVSRVGRDGEALDGDRAKKVLELLSNTSRDEFILQEIPVDTDRLYTIRQDFLVKPVDAWARDLLRAEEIRRSIWLWLAEHRSEFMAGFFALGFLCLLWLWNDARMDRQFILTDPGFADHSVVSSVFAAGAEPPARRRILVSGSDGALLWVTLDNPGIFPRRLPNVNRQDENVSSLENTNHQPNSYAPTGGYLLSSKGDFLVGRENGKNEICRSDVGCEEHLPAGNLAGFLTGMRGVFYVAGTELDLVFVTEKGVSTTPIVLHPPNDWDVNGYLAATASCGNVPSQNIATGIAFLTDGGKQVRLFRCNGTEATHFDLPAAATHIALVESAPRDLFDWRPSNRLLRLAAADSSGCVYIYTLKGVRLRRYPDEDEKEVLHHWPIAPPGQNEWRDTCSARQE